MIGALFVVATLALPSHQVGLSKGTWTQDGAVVDAEIVFSKNENVATSLAQDALKGVRVDVDGVACTPALIGESPTEEDGHAVRLKFTCGHAGRATVDLAPLLSTLAAGHRHLGKVITASGEQDVLAFTGHTSFSFGEAASVASYLLIGVEHIVLGFDHLVFLFGVILIGARLRALIGVITAFTLAHSVTLGLAVLGVWSPPGEIIEPLIAVSIAYVGLENLFVKDANKRWRI